VILSDIRGYGWWGDWWPSWYGYDVCIEQLPAPARAHIKQSVLLRDSATLYSMSSQAAAQGWSCAARQLSAMADAVTV